MPAVQVNYARKTTFGSCFEIGAIIRLATSNLGNYLLAWLAYLVFAIIAGLIGGILASIIGLIPCIGWILAVLITAAIYALDRRCLRSTSSGRSAQQHSRSLAPWSWQSSWITSRSPEIYGRLSWRGSNRSR